MIAPGWRAWAVALAMSILIHGVLSVGLRQPTPGVEEKPTGATVSVSGSLAGILGVQHSEPVEIEEPLAEVEPATIKEVEPKHTGERRLVNSDPVITSQNIQPVQSTPSAEAPQVEPSNLASVTARSVNAAPVSATVTMEPIQVTPVVPLTAAKSHQLKTEQLSEKKRREAERTKKQEKQRRLEQVRRKREEQRRSARIKNIPDHRKAAARSTAGSNRQGQAGTALGGRGGRARASTGSINRYGARVRARILANRPSTRGAGRTVISFGLSTNGGLKYARVARSSGSPRLDRAALIAVRRSSPFPRPPAGATARQRLFSISFSFR
jgi:TonB family protein